MIKYTIIHERQLLLADDWFSVMTSNVVEPRSALKIESMIALNDINNVFTFLLWIFTGKMLVCGPWIVEIVFLELSVFVCLCLIRLFECMYISYWLSVFKCLCFCFRSFLKDSLSPLTLTMIAKQFSFPSALFGCLKC